MGGYRIPRNDLCMSDPMPFSQHWEARIASPISTIENMGEALQSCYSSLRPGDLVNVCSFEKNDWARLVEVASFRIVSCANGKIETVQITEVVKVAGNPKVAVASDDSRLEIVSVRGAFEVRDEKGNTLEAFVARDQAEEYVRTCIKGGNAPKADIVKEDKSGYEVKRGFQGKYVIKNAQGEIVKEFPNKIAAEEYMAA